VLPDDALVPVYRTRAEFRRSRRDRPWVLAGVRVAGQFFAAVPGVEAIRGRLPDAGLLGWASIDQPILAPDRTVAAETALEMARATWPDRVRPKVPFAGGVADG